MFYLLGVEKPTGLVSRLFSQPVSLFEMVEAWEEKMRRLHRKRRSIPMSAM